MKDFVKNAYKKISKMTAEQVSDLMQSLISEKENLSSIFESLSTGLLIVDNSWHLLHHNKAAERLLPFSSRPIDGAEEKIWTHVDNADIAKYLESSAENQRSDISEEFSISIGDTFRFVMIKIGSLVVRTSGDGNSVTNRVAGSIITVDDITQQRQSEILLHRMESLAGLTNLAASVAHEIKNPLGAISIHIQLLQKAVAKSRNGDGLLPDSKFMENYLSVINDEIDRLNKIVVDFLFAVRPVQANIQLSNPDVIIEKFVDFFKPEAESRNIRIDLDLCENTPRIFLDEKLFREVIINLMQNASAAIESIASDTFSTDTGNHQNDFQGIIKISSMVNSEKYLLCFSDNGTGMDEATSSRIFEPYYTTKATGTGLGLTTVYKIIKEFRGDIQVRSSLGKGTTFTISLPVPQNGVKLLEAKG
ncbi:MAG: PAS domain-containing protein [Treponema sp.]|nr:PAS domain-containing protein [Treponema sp.]